VSSLTNLSDPKKRASFAQDVAYEVAQMESPVTVKTGECSKAALLKAAETAKDLKFDYGHLFVTDQE
jgi:hypothetical protein